MSFRFRIRKNRLAFLFFVFVLMATIPGEAAEGCFIERGRTQTVNITKVAVSGHLVTSLQRGSWDTRPTVRVAEISPFGTIEVGSWKPVWNVADIALEATTAFVAADGGLFALDLSDPFNPTELSFVDLIDSHHLAVATFAAWAHPGEFGITVVNLSDPSNPTPVGSWAAPSEVLSLAEYGGAVVAGTEADGVFLIDIHDPANPRQIDHLQELGMGAEDLATAWPSIAASNVVFGTSVLGLHRSCQPPRDSTGRVVP